MKAIRTSACNVIFRADGCVDLPARKGVEEGWPTVSTYWRPDREELAAIAAGMPVKLTLMAECPQACRLEVDTL